MDTARLSAEELDDLIAHLLRVKSVFTAASQLLKPEFFDTAAEPHLAALWLALCELATRYKREVPFMAIYRELQRRLADDPQALTPAQHAALLATPDAGGDGLLYWAYHLPRSALSHDYGVELVRRFVVERGVVHRVVRAAANPYLTDFRELLTETTQLLRTVDISAEQSISAVRADWSQPLLKTFTTGHILLDEWLGGGQAAAEIYGLLAPYGTGKTTWVTYLAVAAAQHFQAKAAAARAAGVAAPLEYAVLATYEEPPTDLQIRVMSCAAAIDKQTLETMSSLASLSRRGDLKPYERQYYNDLARDESLQLDYTQLDGEYERFQRANQTLGNLRILDMTGASGGGDGYVDELAGALAREVEQGRQPGWLGIDYVGAMASAHCIARNLDLDRHKRHYIGGFAKAARAMIGTPYGIPIWALHQFAGKTTGYSPTRRMHHADAAEAKNFAENLNFCICGSNLTPEYVGVLRCTKARRAGTLEQTRLFKLHGALQRPLCADHEYCLTAAAEIVKRQDYYGVAGQAISQLAARERRETANDAWARTGGTTIDPAGDLR